MKRTSKQDGAGNFPLFYGDAVLELYNLRQSVDCVPYNVEDVL